MKLKLQREFSWSSIGLWLIAFAPVGLYMTAFKKDTALSIKLVIVVCYTVMVLLLLQSM